MTLGQAQRPLSSMVTRTQLQEIVMIVVSLCHNSSKRGRFCLIAALAINGIKLTPHEDFFWAADHDGILSIPLSEKSAV